MAHDEFMLAHDKCALAAVPGALAPLVLTTGDVDDVALAVKALAVSNGAAKSGMAWTFEVLARWCADGGAGAAPALMAVAAEAVSDDTRLLTVLLVGVTEGQLIEAAEATVGWLAGVEAMREERWPVVGSEPEASETTGDDVVGLTEKVDVARWTDSV